MLKSLLPPGLLWLLDSDSNLTHLLTATGDEFGRARDRGKDLIEETDPRTATETLDDWERVLGVPTQASTALRRLAVTSRYVAQGGQTAAYFTALVAAAGYTSLDGSPFVFIVDAEDRPLVLRAGFRAGSRCYGTQWAFVWEVQTLDTPLVPHLSHAEMEALVRTAAPAHSTVLFTYFL